MAKSPSDFSCHSYELFVGQEKGNDDNNKEKMSIRSEGLESVSEMQKPTNSVPTAGTMAKVRKVSTVSRRHLPAPRPILSECSCFYVRFILIVALCVRRGGCG